MKSPEMLLGILIYFGLVVSFITPLATVTVSFRMIRIAKKYFKPLFIYTAANELATLQEAFDLYEANTCLTFVRRTNERNYVAVQKTGGG